jgi:hypothetical protein
VNAAWIVLVFVGVFLGGIFASLVGDEIKGWVGRVPYAVLWVASRRVPASHRMELYEDWTADLAAQLQDKSERPSPGSPSAPNSLRASSEAAGRSPLSSAWCTSM